MRVVHGSAEAGVALARAPVDKVLFTGSPAVGRAVARACVSHEKEVTVELGGKDAMLVLVRRQPAPRRRRSAVGGLRGRRPGARVGRARLRRARACTSASLAALVEGARALRVGDPADPRTQVGPLASAAAPGARRRSSSPTRSRKARSCSAAARVQPAGCELRLVLCARGDHRRDARDAPAARARRRAGARGRRGRLGGRGDRAGQRRRLRARRIGVDGRPLPRDAHRARAARRDGLAQRPSPRPHAVARPVGRGRRRRARPHARRGRPAGLRAGKADRLDPAAGARAVVGPV